VGCPYAESVPSFPFPRLGVFAPSPEVEPGPPKRVRIWDDSTPWLITRYNDVREVLSHPAVSSDNTAKGYPGANAAFHEVRLRYPTFVTMDAPEHGRYRRMLAAEFSVKRVEQLRPTIQQVVDELLDTMLAKPSPADFVENFALALPSMMICHLLGVPYEDHEYFQTRTITMGSSRSTRDESAQAARELIDGYLSDLIDRKIAEPGDDVYSRLIVNHHLTGEITRHDVKSLARLLLVAGHDTTANTTALGTLALLVNPDQREKVAEDPDRLMSAVEELLRYVGLTHTGLRRTATADIEVGGQTIAAGEGMICLNVAADLDGSVFADPGAVNIERDNVRDQLAFGFGPHQCLGQNLARAELQTVFRTLFKRAPGIRLAIPLEQVPFNETTHNYGLDALPVAW
jgi:cytochrome P450